MSNPTLSPLTHPANHKDESKLAALLLEANELKSIDWDNQDNAALKDEAARRALMCAGQLFQLSAGWALRHYRELAAEDRRPEHGARQPDPNTRWGAWDRYASGDGLTPVQMRRLVRDILIVIGNDLAIPSDFIDALEALDHCQVLPPLQPPLTGYRLGWVEWRARLTALCYMEYLKQKDGTSKDASGRRIATAFGIEFDSMRDWRVQARERFSATYVDTKIAEARAAGELYRHHSNDTELDWVVRLDCEETWGRMAIEHAVVNYRSARGMRSPDPSLFAE